VKIDWLAHLTAHEGPFATVVTDVSHDDQGAAGAVELRWRAHEERLGRLGVPERVVQDLHEVVASPTRRGGAVGRVVVASLEDGVLLDQLVPQAPPEESCTVGPVPDLVPVLRAFAGSASYVLAVVDAAGADVQVVSARGDELEAGTVVGEHDVLHKVPGGGWAHRRFQLRVEDSVDRDAGQVSQALDTEVRRHRPELVLLAGEPRPVSAVADQVGEEVRSRLVRLRSGSRADGADAESLVAEVESVVRERVEARRCELVEDWTRAAGQERDAAQGLDDTATALARGQVQELLVDEGALGDRSLWAFGAPTHLAAHHEDLPDGAGDDGARVAAASALVWAALGTGAGVTLVDGGDGGPELADGCGALLRRVDDSTPRDPTPALPGHGG
jgi:hypothetical protein